MNSPIHNIFSDTGCIDANALEQYSRNELVPQQKHEVERHLVDCELCSDALEGLALASSPAVIEEVRQKVLAQTTGSTPRSLTPGRVMLAAASVSAVILVSYFSYTLFEQAKDETTVLTQSENIIPAEPAVQNIVKESPDDVPTGANKESVIGLGESADELAAAPSMIEEESVNDGQGTGIVTTQTNPDQLDIEQEYSESDNLDESRSEETPVIEEVELVKDTRVSSASISGKEFNSFKGTSNVGYINDYKVFVDPANTQVKKVPDHKPKSLSPRYENKQAAKVADEPPVKREVLTYEQALESALVEFENSNYNRSIDKLQEIDNNFPGDRNAAFYSGMSNYHIGNYSLALQYLEPISKDKEDIFNQEAEYYTALSNYKAGKTKKAVKMLESIRTRNDFYAGEAENALDTLKK